jgi:hypothetical protein
MKVLGKPYAGKLHVRFDEGEREAFALLFLYSTGKKITAEIAEVRRD